MKNFCLYILLSLFVTNQALAEQVRIEGFVPDYIGKEVFVFSIDDFLSLEKTKIATTTVSKADSTFTVNFDCDHTQKIYLQLGKNKTQMYIQPGGEYNIYVFPKDKYAPFRPEGNEVQMTFFGLAESDINYKILKFEKWNFDFLSVYYRRSSNSPTTFVNALDTFKVNVQRYYKEDTSRFFKNYVKYTIAGLDDLSFKGSMSRKGKYDMYMYANTIEYSNDRYMEYFKTFYDDYDTQISRETNKKFYDAVLHGSPKMAMVALGGDHYLKNLRVRELVLVKMLSDIFYSPDYPQTNIMTMLDSISTNSYFKANGPIAKNIISRLTTLVPGGKAPEFYIVNGDETLSLKDFAGKHLYIQFANADSKTSLMDMELLKPIYSRYGGDVAFLTVVVGSSNEEADQLKTKKEIPWKVIGIDDNHDFVTRYKAVTKPYYVLIDQIGYVVAAPAPTPRPDGEYDTVDKMFYGIRKMKERRGQ